MRLKYFYLSILLLVSIQAGASPEIQHWQTSKGAAVFFVEANELPIVDIQIMFDAGGARDPQAKKGLAMLTNSLLNEAAAGLDADAISYEFERLGAIYSASSGYDSATVSLRSLSDKQKLTTALANLKRVISSPDFPDKVLERQRKRILIGIQRKQQSPAALASDAFYTAIYNKHPYAFPNEGTQESITAIQRDDVVAFYNKHYTARNAVIAIVGDLDKQQAEVLAEEMTQALHKGSTLEPIPAVEPLTAGDEIRIRHDSTQVHILLGQPGNKRGDPYYFPFYVGYHVLGCGGMVSRIFEEIREKRGLSYSAYSYFSPMREYGPFLAGLQTRADQAEEALSVLRENIRVFIENGPTASELEASKKNITGGFPLRLGSNSKILGYIAMIGFYGLPLDYLDTFTANVEAVTIEQIKDAFRRRLQPDKMVTVMVGPVNASAEQAN